MTVPTLRVLVSDASPIIALADAGLGHLVPDLGLGLDLPQTVADEAGITTTRHGLASVDWLRVHPDPAPLPATRRLDRGEAAAVALAIILRADAILLDDLAGRKVAQSLGLTVIGTAALVVRAKHRGIIPSAAQALDLLQSTGWHLGQKVRLRILEMAGEG